MKDPFKDYGWNTDDNGFDWEDGKSPLDELDQGDKKDELTDGYGW